MSAARRLLLYARCAAFLVPWLLHLFAADILLSALLPLSAVFPSLCYDLSSRVAERVWRGIQSIFTRVNGAEIIVSGADALPTAESAVVVANHVEWTDFYMVQALALRAGMLGRCRWFAKEELKWVPFLGWGLWAMSMPLVSRRAMEDRREMERVFGGVLRRAWPIWLVAYSEGTRYTSAKRAEAVKWCEANGKTLPPHTLYPRTKGFIACVQQLRQAQHVRGVYDITVAYARGMEFMSPPSFAQTLFLPRLSEQWRFFVHVERFAIGGLPQTDAELAKWLEERWMEKGRRLEGLRDRLARGIPWTETGSSSTRSKVGE